ncbi:LOW QUALITY PROTEIN: mucin-5AC [Trachemys scripta elegans]|uniref:LOW QUALITY PROTEIN: mucin-5AC n=1 Tax=Trachemys scripta elegans TaxID=31138 RepID=UPI0015539B03|nr:LOW QUALITY PROTEIN: mucin-5AC [Trachemys scripta elegans]
MDTNISDHLYAEQSVASLISYCSQAQEKQLDELKNHGQRSCVGITKIKAQYEDQQANYDDYNYVQQGQDYFSVPVTKPQEVTIIQPLRTTLPVKPGNPAHNGRVCSTWGNFHFKTFDGDIFHFPGLCNYVFASHCKSAYEDFNIQIRRTMLESSPVINHITLKLDGMVIELTSDSIVVNGNPIQLPFSQSGILIERSSGYLKITAKMGLVFMWNQLDGLLVELDKKYANQTCGLCGDFNGIPIYNEFTSNNIKLTDVQFGNMQKMDGPTEQCEDPTSSSLSNCSNEFSAICQRVLTGEAFVSCNALVDVQDYIDSCVQDLCRCDESMRDFCICNTFAEYSRQCAHAGGQPLNWRTKELCNKTCPYNMQHEECGSPCANTCTNPERSALCEDHCTDGCVCPPGTVSDDINSSGCIPLSECHCTYKGETYSPGASFASQCTSCTCTGGQWSCVSLSCPGTCSIEGGSHISTFDEKRYSFFGDCSYILTKLCDSDSFTVLGEVRKCGLTDTETCLKGVAISIGGGQTIVVIKPSGSVFVNTIYTQLPISAANVTIFRPSSFFIIVQTNFGLQVQIQLVPIMQLFVNLDPSHKGQTCGLCGNFNNIQADDFKATSGVVEGTAAAFANTWKIQGDCPNVKNIFENPCTLSIENEKYAQHWCGLLTDTQGPFAECHSTVNPDVYHTNCLFDTCNCEKSEDCMCAALSTYVRACAAKGVLLNGWRTNVCTITSCPKSLTYSYVVSSCQPTCRSLSEPDVTCNIKFTPVDGCTCANGTYMDENGKCVPATSCPCYYKGSVLPSGEVVHDNGVICSCTHGKLDCVRVKPEPVCAAPMVYFDCSNVTAGTIGSECQKSCQTLDMGCYSTQCVSGCVCPNGLVSDGKGGCVAAGECPCVHNDASYNPGETIKVNCNTCTCKNRMWQCTNESCLATCSVYGDGHYITFDGKRFSFSGDCEYTLVQDYCGKNSTSLGTFRVITENIPCGTTGTTCSKAIKVFLGNYELVLSDGKFEVIEKVRGGEVPYKVRYMGIYMVIDTNNGLILMWDKKTSIFIKLSPDFKGQVCGLCGNYDGNGINDFTTRSQSVVGDVLEFGNSWKVSPTCPDAKSNKDPCTANPYRNSWAQKQCSIINSKVFAACHSQVEPNEYYEACVTDACACDTGGDCECFCTAVASYAQACNEAGICVAWRTPSICPLFCDYYNPQGECEWHYKPCGSPCMKTCRNRSGKCLHELQGLEGCYPKCPENKPYFDEDDMECVDSCGCYDTKGKYYKPGTPIRSEENCQSCECTMNGIECEYDEDECHCTYDGKQYEYEDVIYDTTDGIGGCIIATCGHNGTIDRKVYACSTPSTTTPFSFSSSTPISTTTVTPTTSVCVREVCQWSQWYDVSYPGSGINDGDFDTFDNLRAKGYKVCKAPKAVECRSEKFPNTPLNELEQKVECSTTRGLICYNKDQHQMICDNFQIKILCCSFVPCEYTTPATTTPAETTTPITKTITPETTVTGISSTTTALPTTTESKTTTLSTSTMTSKTPSTSPVTETTSVSTSTLTTTAPSTTIPETTASPSTETVYTTGEITSITPCKPKCKWSEWHDVHFPSLDNKGDSETYDDIRAAGKVICSKPENIECRAEKFPEKSIDNIGQIVQCNVSFGLVCRNEDQEGVLQMCYNYQIKVFCCDDFSHCPSTSTTTETTTTAGTTIVSTKPSTQTPITTETTTSTIRTTPSTTTTTETTTKEIKTTTPLTTTPIETTTITTTPFTTTTTETTTTPGTPIVSTETSTLTPTTTETTSTVGTTHSSTTSIETTTVTTTPFTTTTTETTTTPGTPIVSTETSTLTPTTTETTSIGTTHSSITSTETTTVTTTPFTATTTQTTTTTGTTTMTTPQTTTTIPTTTPITSTPIPDTFTTTTTSPTTTQTTEFTTIISTITTPTTTETTTATTTTPISTTKPTSSIIVTTTPAITTISETTTPVTTVPPTTHDCFKELCEWSQWYDVSYPRSAINGGDFDTFKNIRAKGYNVCKAPKAVECRAERFPNTPLNELEQNVICSKTEGLICYNKDQLPPICYNYQIKIECCRNVIVSCPTTTLATTTTVKSTPPIPTTTPTITPIVTTTPATTTTVTTIQPNQPDISIDQIGQVVQCDANFGLVCKNEDQIGKFKMCFNYQIRVLCCEENVNCLVTTSILPTMPTRVTTPTISSTPTGTTEVTMTTTHCFCQIEDAVYASGEMIYNKTDKDGCNFYAICSKTCSVERFKGPCKSTTPATATTTTPTTSTSIPTTTPTTTVSSTTKIECPDAKPPRKMGETWKISNCTTATCEGNNKVVIQKVKCPPVKKITCANGYPPVEVFSEDGCCYHYECECVCSGWGDPHYITFDGTYYTFLDNCTYTLVKQITPKYDNFRVDIDNYFCDAEDGLSCPQSIIVYYKYTVVVLTRELYNGVMANKIIFNKTVVNPGFKKDGISIYMLGINMVVEIPEIGATITFSGLIFSVKLPFSKFGNNTEGQCGTCSNTKIDDCRLPSGKIISSCTQMAPHWKVDDDKKRYCVGTTPPPSTPTPAPSCPPSALCKIILSEVFEECHKVIPPQDFYKGCVFDACHMTNASMQCSGLEIYATLCATRGVCIDWRGETQGKCPYNCPVGKVYKPCGPLNPATCDSRAVQHNGTGLTEGCFCPEGKFLFNANSDVCVSGCGNCIGPDGQPKLPGDQWKSNCQDCVCDRYTVTVQCTKRPCKPLPPVSCDDPGFVPVQSLTQEDPCCVQTECRCDTSKCPESVASCQPGYELIPEVLNGNCCTIFTCKLKPGCVTNGTFYMPGAVIPKGTCEKCTCSAEVQPDSQRNIVACQPIPCDTECPLGYEYKMKSGQCCGECVQVACVLKMKDNTVHVLQAGKVWHEPGDNCTFYKCEQIEDQFIPVTVRKACQPIYPEDCDPADIMLSEDGCCKTCPLPRKTCSLRSTTTVISQNDCNSSVPVELTYCEGNCDTSSMYSLEANVMQHKCKCCQEIKTSKRQVTLSCPDGSTTDYSYTHVEQCDCAGTECIPQAPPTTPAQQQEQEQQQQEQIQQQQGQS